MTPQFKRLLNLFFIALLVGAICWVLPYPFISVPYVIVNGVFRWIGVYGIWLGLLFLFITAGWFYFTVPKMWQCLLSGFSAVALIMCAIFAYRVLHGGEVEEIYESHSADEHKLVVYREQRAFAMPGDSGSWPGYIRLYDYRGKLLGVYLFLSAFNLVTPEWNEETVYIKLFVEFSLEDGELLYAHDLE